MDSTGDPALDTFVQSVLNNLAKNGFPASKVSFPIESMYDAASRKGISFNKVLDVLSAQGISHTKTVERIVFEPPQPAPAPAGGFPGMEGLDMSALQNMSPDQMMAAAAEAMKQMSPDQLQAIQGMVEGMSDEERAEMLEQAKKMGLG